MMDARGLSCPIPVVMVQKAVKNEPQGVSILVDDRCAVENITRFGRYNGYVVNMKEEDGAWALTLTK